MSFFNQKEDVYDIQLTPYGKRKIVEGKFNPSYYTFFDDDIVYDPASFSVSYELQNDIEERILKKSLYLKNQTMFSSSSPDSNDIPDFFNYYGLPLADAEDSSQYFPAFEISFAEGEIDNIDLQSDLQYNKFGSEYIPQINLKERYIDIVIDRKTSIQDLTQDQFSFFNIAEDGSHIWVQIRNYTFDVFEHNVETFNKNFDVEIYKIEEGKAEKLSFDYFVGLDDGIIENGILQDTQGASSVPTFLDDSESIGFMESDLLKVSSYFDYRMDVLPEQTSNNRLYIYGGKGFKGRGGTFKGPLGDPECE